MLLVKNDPIKIIKEHARKEFKSIRFREDKYTSVMTSIIDELRKDKASIIEKKLDVEQEIYYLELHNFDNFMGIRLGYYAYFFAVITMILFDKKLQIDFGLVNLHYWIAAFIVFGIFILASNNFVSYRQKHRLIYLKFKLVCIEKIGK